MRQGSHHHSVTADPSNFHRRLSPCQHCCSHNSPLSDPTTPTSRWLTSWTVGVVALEVCGEDVRRSPDSRPRVRSMPTQRTECFSSLLTHTSDTTADRRRHHGLSFSTWPTRLCCYNIILEYALACWYRCGVVWCVVCGVVCGVVCVVCVVRSVGPFHVAWWHMECMRRGAVRRQECQQRLLNCREFEKLFASR